MFIGDKKFYRKSFQKISFCKTFYIKSSRLAFPYLFKSKILKKIFLEKKTVENFTKHKNLKESCNQEITVLREKCPRKISFLGKFTPQKLQDCHFSTYFFEKHDSDEEVCWKENKTWNNFFWEDSDFGSVFLQRVIFWNKMCKRVRIWANISHLVKLWNKKSRTCQIMTSYCF